MPDVVQNSWGVNEGFSGLHRLRQPLVGRHRQLRGRRRGDHLVGRQRGPGAGPRRSPADRATTLYNAFSVGAVDATNYDFPYPIASFSSRGPTGCSVPAPTEDQARGFAPGVNVYSSVPSGGYAATGTAPRWPVRTSPASSPSCARPTPTSTATTIKRILMQDRPRPGHRRRGQHLRLGHHRRLRRGRAAMVGFGTLSGTVSKLVGQCRSQSGGARPSASATSTAAGFVRHGSRAPGQLRGLLRAAGLRRPGAPGHDRRGQVTVQNVSLVDMAGPTITDVSQPMATPDTHGPYAISARITDPSTVVAAVLHVRVDAGGWQELPMSGSGDVYSAAIAGQPADTSIDYYVSAPDGAGLTSTDPADAPAEPTPCWSPSPRTPGRGTPGARLAARRRGRRGGHRHLGVLTPSARLQRRPAPDRGRSHPGPGEGASSPATARSAAASAIRTSTTAARR